MSEKEIMLRQVLVAELHSTKSALFAVTEENHRLRALLTQHGIEWFGPLLQRRSDATDDPATSTKPKRIVEL
jgi:hypothetical protein